MKNFEKLVMNTKTDILFNNNCVELPNDLLKEIISGKVVIFAGAGISTERKYCFKKSDLYHGCLGIVAGNDRVCTAGCTVPL